MKLIYTLLCSFLIIQIQAQTLRTKLTSINTYWNHFNVPDEDLDKVVHLTDDEAYIAKHLYYVEKTLRSIQHNSFSDELQQKRLYHLDVLKEYYTKGKFPKNTFHPNERVPYFIDIYNTPCAVGHLITESGGADLAKQINKENNYGYLMDLANKYPQINKWAETNGFTLEELAWIQPSYQSNVIISDTTYAWADSNCNPNNFLYTETGGFVIDSNDIPNFQDVSGVWYSNDHLRKSDNLGPGSYDVWIDYECNNRVYLTTMEVPKREGIKIKEYGTNSNGMIVLDTINSGLFSMPYAASYQINGMGSYITKNISQFPDTILLPMPHCKVQLEVYSQQCTAYNKTISGYDNNEIDSVQTIIIQGAVCPQDTMTIDYKLYQAGSVFHTVTSKSLPPLNSAIYTLTNGCPFDLSYTKRPQEDLKIAYDVLKYRSCKNDTAKVLFWVIGSSSPMIDTGVFSFYNLQTTQLTFHNSAGCSISMQYTPDSIQFNPPYNFSIKVDSCALPLPTLTYKNTHRASSAIPCFNEPIDIYDSLSINQVYTLQPGFNHIVIIDSATGCPGGTVNYNLAANYPIQTSNSISQQAVCFGDTMQYNVIAIGGTSPYIGTGKYNINNNTPFAVTVTDAGGCSATTIINPSNYPTAIALSTVASSILCYGDTSNVMVSATGGTPPYSNIGSQIALAGTYTYAVQDANGCSAAIVTTITQPIQLTVNQNVTAPLCYGQLGNITISSNGGVAPYNGQGSFNVPAGIYTYNLIDANGCKATSIITLTQPNLLTLNNLSVFVDNATNVTTINAIVNGATGTYTISLLKQNANGIYLPFQNSIQLPVNVTGVGNYQLVVIDANGCSTSYNFSIAAPVNINNAMKNSIEISPNPAAQILFIKNIPASVITLNLFDICGRLIDRQAINSAQVTLNISNYANGVYYLKIGNESFKWIKE